MIIFFILMHDFNGLFIFENKKELSIFIYQVVHFHLNICRCPESMVFPSAPVSIFYYT